jgi:murein DD-endopeptidase MepM/ murein hydrolase activator NlpD
MKKNFLLVLFVLFSPSVFTQSKNSKTTPKKKPFFTPINYNVDFGSPVKIPISLAGNFGECRPNHFHSGLDVRTEQRENLNLYSIGDGYVSKVTISHKGFGTCLYISHPGGFTSVYAHCNRFYSTFWKYLEKKQYEKEKWDIELQFPPHLFPVRKGQFIAKSGNTGSSHAPHLHMEIRDTKTDKTLNGLLFYKKMNDAKKPIINRVAVYDANRSIYHQEPKVFKAIKNGNHDVPTTKLIKVNSDKVYFGIQANDYMKNSLRLGIFRMKLIVDGKELFGWQLNNIGYDETRYMNSIGDYKTKMGKGFWLQLCHKLPNDQLGIYVSGTQKDGVVNIGDGKAHNVIIRVYDVKGNRKDVRFQVQGVGEGWKPADCKNLLKQGKKNEFDNGKIAFELPKPHLYDNLCFTASATNSSKPYSYFYRVHNSGVPVHDYFDLKLKPKQAIPEKLKDKVAVLFTPEEELDIEKVDGQAAAYKKGWVVAKVRKFGNYVIVLDQSAPAIIPYFKNGRKVSKGNLLKFGAEDNVSQLKEVRMEVDGKWLRCSRRKNNYYYYVDEHFPVGKHEVTIRAVDGNNNVAVKKFSLSR